MRPTLVLVLLAVLLAIGGTLFVLFGSPERALAVEGGTAANAPAAPAAGHADLVKPTAEPVQDALGKAERTSIEAPAVVAGPNAKSPSATTLFGRVLDSAGQPIVGAEVRARLGDFEMPEFEVSAAGAKKIDPLRVQSDAQGRFEIAGVKPGSVRIAVRAPGFVPLNQPGIGVPAVARHDVGDLALETSVVLDGRVVDSHGAGVEGARLVRGGSDGVMFLDASDETSSGPPPLAVTAADGSFRIDQLATGPWRMRITSETHPDKTENGVTKRPGERVTGLVFVLEDGYEIAGRVTGVPAASVGSASVIALPPQTQNELVIVGFDEGGFGENRRRAKLASDGSFVVKGLRQGAYQLQARVKAGQDVFWPRSASERVDAKSGDRGIVIAWQPASVLAFQVVDAKTKAPIEPLVVSANTRSPAMFFDPSRSESRRYENGLVRIDDLRPRDANDRATLDVASVGYEKLHVGDIALIRGGETDLGVLELQRATTVDVLVQDSVTHAAVAGAKVTLREVEADAGGPSGAFGMRRAISVESTDGGEVSFGGDDDATARTDAEGRARLNSKPGKRGKLTVRMDGYAPYEGEAFDMPKDVNVEQIVALDQGGSVEITLLSAAGDPVASARIDHRAPDAGNDPFAEFGGGFNRGKGPATDAAGRVTIANLAPGVHRFRPAKSGGPQMEEGMVFAVRGKDSTDTSWSEVQIVRGETASLVLREPEVAEVKGRVREGGSTLAGASITLKKRGGDPGMEGMEDLPFGGGGGPRSKSDGEGRYRFEKVEAGSYELVVRHATRAMAARFPIEVDASGLEYDILLPISILEGRIADAENKPVAGAKVWAERKPAGGQNREARAISIMAGGEDGGMVFDSAAGFDASRARTDAEGRYTLRGVESDVDLIVRAEAKDCEPGKSEPVSVALGQTRGGVDLELAAAGQIKVKLVSASGKSAAPCMVHADYDDELPDGKTVQPKVEFAQGGSVTLKGLRPGRWKVYADPLNFGGEERSPPSEKKSVLVVARETAQAELEIP
ncbi:MAG TPA: carboxypeptidase-like regulatory domain-containing protein [Planctomycetota bacterium]|nr:carboxypeptidase-like regulatory domain-containing protein [Planctomycetota bacterium]